jgi:hypothetical protein
MSDTHDEPTEGPVKISWASRSNMCHIVCAPPSEDGLPDNHIVDVIPPGQGFQGSRDEMDANAELIKAAFTTAHELPDEYDAVAAMEELPELIRGLEELVSCLKEAHENAHPEGPMRDRRYGLAVDEAQDTLNAARADE